jgi:hypothetical protein
VAKRVGTQTWAPPGRDRAQQVDPGRRRQRHGHLTRSLASGSYLAISHATHDGRNASAVRAAVKVYSRVARSHTRGHEAVHAFFAGLDLLEPGLLFIPRWPPDGSELFSDHPERSMGYAGRKP